MIANPLQTRLGVRGWCYKRAPRSGLRLEIEELVATQYSRGRDEPADHGATHACGTHFLPAEVQAIYRAPIEESNFCL